MLTFALHFACLLEREKKRLRKPCRHVMQLLAIFLSANCKVLAQSKYQDSHHHCSCGLRWKHSPNILSLTHVHQHGFKFQVEIFLYINLVLAAIISVFFFILLVGTCYLLRQTVWQLDLVLKHVYSYEICRFILAPRTENFICRHQC